MNYFKMPRSDQRTHEESLRPLSEVYHFALDIMNFPLEMLQSTVYGPNTGSLSLQLSPSSKVEAYAFDRQGKNIDHGIVISYPMVAAIWRDDLAFSIYAKNLFGIADRKRWRRIFDLYKAKGRALDPDSIVLPKGMNSTYSTHQIFTLAMMWLFNHEAAHLLQSHGAIRGKAGGTSVCSDSSIEVNEFYSHDNTGALTPEESWVWHVTELAADFEATISTLAMLQLQIMDYEKVRAVNAADELWLYFVSLALVFFRFWEFNKEPFSAEAIGTHPHPGIRYYMAIRTINDVINKSNSYFSRLSIKKRIAIADDAFMSAGLFWIHRHDADISMRKSFADVVLGDAPGIIEYLAKANGIWEGLKGDVIANHLSDGVKLLFELDLELTERIKKTKPYM